MRRPLMIPALLSVALLTAAAAIASTDPVPEEIPATAPPEAATADPESCAAPACHGDLIEADVIHPAAEDCSLCHAAAEVGHLFTLAAEAVAELCAACHDDPVAGRPRIHAPVEAGECTTCHDPHASDHPFLLVEAAPDLCVGCHSDQADELGLRHVHGPVRDPGCPICHDPHAADLPFLLVVEGNALCAGCHLAPPGSASDAIGRGLYRETVDAAPRFALSADGRGHPVQRHPVTAVPDPSNPERSLGCDSCHVPHASDARALRVLGETGGFCTRCHHK